MQPERHNCGLRVVRHDPDRATPDHGLRCGGDAGAIWLLLMRFIGWQMAGRRTVRRSVSQALEVDIGSGSTAGSACGKSIQNVVPMPTSLSKPI